MGDAAPRSEEELLSKVRRDLSHIAENLDKRQYLNAAALAADIVPDLLALFGLVRRAGGDR